MNFKNLISKDSFSNWDSLVEECVTYANDHYLNYSNADNREEDVIKKHIAIGLLAEKMVTQFFDNHNVSYLTDETTHLDTGLKSDMYDLLLEDGTTIDVKTIFASDEIENFEWFNWFGIKQHQVRARHVDYYVACYLVDEAFKPINNDISNVYHLGVIGVYPRSKVVQKIGQLGKFKNKFIVNKKEGLPLESLIPITINEPIIKMFIAPERALSNDELTTIGYPNELFDYLNDSSDSIYKSFVRTSQDVYKDGYARVDVLNKNANGSYYNDFGKRVPKLTYYHTKVDDYLLVFPWNLEKHVLDEHVLIEQYNILSRKYKNVIFEPLTYSLSDFTKSKLKRT